MSECEQKGVHGIAREDGRTRPDALQCELICIPPDRVHLVWPRVAGLIEAAMRRGDLSSFAAVAAAVSGGHALLWVAIARQDGRKRPGDGSEIAAAAVTELHQTEWRKVCCIVACGGEHRERWLELIEPIEEFARAEGCSAMRIMGRKGWARVLPKYRIRRVVLEKEL